MTFRPLVVIPAFNSGSRLAPTARAAADHCADIWIVDDASTDGSVEAIAKDGRFRVLHQATNAGKGAAVEVALRAAFPEGFTHALVLDADGQHPADRIGEFFEISRTHPAALVAGVPVFGPDAPPERVRGRMVGNALASLLTLGQGARDSLFGFRVYPIRAALDVFEATGAGRRFDFDTILAVRLRWGGTPVINRPVPVVYPSRTEGGVSHFRYVRDNVLLARRYVGLFFEWPLRIPDLLSSRCRP